MLGAYQGVRQVTLLRVANDLAAHAWQLAFLSHEFVLFWSCALIHLSHTCHLRSKAIGLSSPKPVSYEKETATLLASPFDEFVKVQVDATNGVAGCAMLTHVRKMRADAISFFRIGKDGNWAPVVERK